jgi:hypothetical protein
MKAPKPSYNPDCFLARVGHWEGPGPMPSCDGRLVKAHLIPKQTLLRELAAEVSPGAIWDHRVWVLACGGPIGNAGHHGHLDYSKRIRLPREVIPASTEDFAEQYGLVWVLDRLYGERHGY